MTDRDRHPRRRYGTFALPPERRRKVTFRIEGGKAKVMKLEQGALEIEGSRASGP